MELLVGEKMFLLIIGCSDFKKRCLKFLYKHQIGTKKSVFISRVFKGSVYVVLWLGPKKGGAYIEESRLYL